MYVCVCKSIENYRKLWKKALISGKYLNCSRVKYNVMNISTKYEWFWHNVLFFFQISLFSLSSFFFFLCRDKRCCRSRNRLLTVLNEFSLSPPSIDILWIFLYYCSFFQSSLYAKPRTSLVEFASLRSSDCYSSPRLNKQRCVHWKPLLRFSGKAINR